MSCPCDHIETGKQPGCACDQRTFPPALHIPAGLTRLPRQAATFPEFRSAMLGDVRKHHALRNWRARGQDDHGVMLLEMWAYICDSLTFYDEAIANEAYLRTALRRPSLRRLVQLLGYLPRPAVASLATLAAFADGRQPVKLPVGTAFRSGAFDGEPPQVFELDVETFIHSFYNRWNVKPPVPTTVGTANPNHLYLAPSAEIKDGTLLLLTHGGRGQAVVAKTTEAVASPDGRSLLQVTFYQNLSLQADTPLAGLRLFTPTQSVGIKNTNDNTENALTLAGTVAQIYPGDDVVVFINGAYRWRKVQTVQEVQLDATSEVTVNGVKQTIHSKVPHTKLVFESNNLVANLNLQTAVATAVLSQFMVPTASVATASAAGAQTATNLQSASMVMSSTIALQTNLVLSNAFLGQFRQATIVHYGMREAGRPTRPASTVLDPSAPGHLPLQLTSPLEQTDTLPSPLRFFLEDKNKSAVAVEGEINYPAARLEVTKKDGWLAPFTLPVEVQGNLIGVSRGERVENELLGSGDGSLPNQRFKLKKKPLTYLLAPTEGNDSGVKNTLSVYVNGIRWSEVATFFGKKENEQVYVVRQDDEGETWVSFGDGQRGERLPTGTDNVVGHYRFGAGAAAPPAGALNQIGKPVVGLQSVKNPLPAYGGADAESPEQLREYAPKSALVLGRAVSIQDMAAVVLSVPGVRAVQAEWRWHGIEQRTVAHIRYVGEAGIEGLVRQRLLSVSEDAAPIRVEVAKGLPTTLSIDIQTDARYVEKDVMVAVRLALTNPKTGLLAPENVGIGRALFRSQIFDAVLDVPGALSVGGIYLNGSAFADYGKLPGAGNYFDFEQGTLLLNGKDTEA